MTLNDLNAKNTIRPGSGTLIGSTPLGFFVANPHSGMSFNHPFRPVLVGSGTEAGLRFARGVVDGMEPKIGTVPMSGTGGALPPILTLSGVSSPTTESWAMLLVTPNAQGLLDKDSRIEIVHRTSLGSGIGKTGAQPLALIVWENKLPVMVWPMVFFNLRYARKTSGNEGTRHFFL